MMLPFGKSQGVSRSTGEGTARCPRVGKPVLTFAEQKKVPSPQGGSLFWLTTGETLEVAFRYAGLLALAMSGSKISQRGRRR